MTRVVIALLVWFGVAIAVTEMAATVLESWRTKAPTDADAAAALEVRAPDGPAQQ